MAADGTALKTSGRTIQGSGGEVVLAFPKAPAAYLARTARKVARLLEDSGVEL